VVGCSYGYRKHPDPSRLADAGRIANPGRIADPGSLIGPRGRAANRDGAVKTVTANEPVSGYDGLKTRQLVASLSSHSQVELTEIEGYERDHENRRVVFDKLRWLRQDEPLPGYDALSGEEVVAALERADLATIKRVRGYERKFAARRVVLDEVTRLHGERRQPLVSRDAEPRRTSSDELAESP
jgi:hypothetical protein